MKNKEEIILKLDELSVQVEKLIRKKINSTFNIEFDDFGTLSDNDYGYRSGHFITKAGGNSGIFV